MSVDSLPPLESELAEYGADVLREWMRRFVDDREGSPREGQEVRVRWYDDGTAGLCEFRDADPFAFFRFTVNVERLPDLPPIGPECDPAQIEEARGVLCFASITRMDGIERDTDYCDLSAGHGGLHSWESPPPAPPEWIAIPWTQVRDNDRIRIGAAETTVLNILHEGPWQTEEPRGNVFKPKPWRHCETWVELEAWRDDPDPTKRRRPVMRPQETIEVLMTAERKAVHLLAGAFGTVEDVTTEGD